MSADQHKHGPQDERDYADKDIRLRPIILFGIYTTIFTALVFAGVQALFGYLNRKAEAVKPVSQFATERQLPPAPLLQVDEKRTLQQQLAIENAQLHGYAWVDQKAGVVRIPIDRAMELIAERGLPSRADAAN